MNMKVDFFLEEVVYIPAPQRQAGCENCYDMIITLSVEEKT